MKTPTKEEIRAKADKEVTDYGKPEMKTHNVYLFGLKMYEKAYTQALTDMQQPVDVEALKQEFCEDFIIERDKASDDLVDYFVRNISRMLNQQQPAPQSDAEIFRSFIRANHLTSKWEEFLNQKNNQ